MTVDHARREVEGAPYASTRLLTIHKRMTTIAPIPHADEVPYGYCHCGCGRKAAIAKTNWGSNTAGEPMRYAIGHWRKRVDRYEVDPETGCWNWQGTVNAAGYGSLSTAGNGRVRAHRAYYERHRGPIPDGLVIDHLCRNRRCVNPDHLEPVTHAENCRRGEMAKLTREQVAEIRESTESAQALTERFGLSISHVNHLRRGRHWGDE